MIKSRDEWVILFYDSVSVFPAMGQTTGSGQPAQADALLRLPFCSSGRQWEVPAGTRRLRLRLRLTQYNGVGREGTLLRTQ